MKKILIIRFSSIGDIVLTTPVVRCVKQQTEYEVHYLSKKQFQSILEPNIYIDKLHLIDEDVSEIIPQLKAERFEEIIDLHNNIRTLRIKKALGIKSTSFPKLNLKKWILVNAKINLLPDIHIVDRYMSTVAHLNIKNDNKGLDFFLRPEDVVELKEEFPKIEGDYATFVIGGQHEGKMCSVKKIAEICSLINLPVILLGGPEDEKRGNQIVKLAGKHIYNAAGKYKLGQSAYLLKYAHVVITHDTGLMHIASAFKKKIISLWGGTVPELGMYPYLPGEGSVVLEQKHFMRPSSKLGTRNGVYKLWNFMDMIPNEKIISALSDKTVP